MEWDKNSVLLMQRDRNQSQPEKQGQPSEVKGPIA